MSDVVAKTIEALRVHLGAENDIELGRKLRVAKSTISSWRARGTVPERYKKILEGDSHQMMLVPMNSWSSEEQLAFNLALFRFSSATQAVIASKKYRSNLDLFLQGHLVVVLAVECQKELSAMIDERGYDPATAFGILVHDDLEQGEAAIDRTLQHLRKNDLRSVEGL